jgi:hypothetical protein
VRERESAGEDGEGYGEGARPRANEAKERGGKFREENLQFNDGARESMKVGRPRPPRPPRPPPVLSHLHIRTSAHSHHPLVTRDESPAVTQEAPLSCFLSLDADCQLQRCAPPPYINSLATPIATSSRTANTTAASLPLQPWKSSTAVSPPFIRPVFALLIGSADPPAGVCVCVSAWSVVRGEARSARSSRCSLLPVGV